MPETTTTSVRLDKWLWAARFFKTRSLATAAINNGKVHVDDQRSKPSREVHVGMRLNIRSGEVAFEITVMEVRSQRASAPIAQQMYQETPEGKTARAQHAELRRQQTILYPDSPGRPSKKDRRAIIRFTRNT